MAAKKGQGYEERMARGKKCLNVWISDEAMGALDALRKGRSRAQVVEELARAALRAGPSLPVSRPAQAEVARARQELSRPRPAPTPPLQPAREPLQASQLDPHRRRPQARPVALSDEGLSAGARIGRRSASLLHGGQVGDGQFEDD